MKYAAKYLVVSWLVEVSVLCTLSVAGFGSDLCMCSPLRYDHDGPLNHRIYKQH